MSDGECRGENARFHPHPRRGTAIFQRRVVVFPQCNAPGRRSTSGTAGRAVIRANCFLITPIARRAHAKTLTPSSCPTPRHFSRRQSPRRKQPYFCKTVKLAHTRLPSVGFRSWSRFLAVSLQVTWVINPAVGCHYFQPGLQLPRNP